jgi:hypothetical protein
MPSKAAPRLQHRSVASVLGHASAPLAQQASPDALASKATLNSSLRSPRIMRVARTQASFAWATHMLLGFPPGVELGHWHRKYQEVAPLRHGQYSSLQALKVGCLVASVQFHAMAGSVGNGVLSSGTK